MRAAAREPADRDIRDRDRVVVAKAPRPRIAVVTFPGSNDDRDAAHALDLLGADAEGGLARGRAAAGRRRRRPARRFLVRRLSALRRDRPVRARDGGGDAVRRGRRARCSESATASRSCARHGCFPACCGRTRRCRSCAATSRSASRTRTTLFTSRCDPGQRLVIPVKHGEGCWTYPDARQARGLGPDRPPLRAGLEPERLPRRRRRRDQLRRKRDGPDAASGARRRPAARLDRRQPHPGLARRRGAGADGRRRLAPFRRNAAASSG